MSDIALPIDHPAETERGPLILRWLVGFWVVSLLATFGAFSDDQSASIAATSRWAVLLCFAGVGLTTELLKLGALGARPLAVGVVGISVVTFALVADAQAAGWLG